jgi:hypothetical protein
MHETVAIILPLALTMRLPCAYQPGLVSGAAVKVSLMSDKRQKLTRKTVESIVPASRAHGSP